MAPARRSEAESTGTGDVYKRQVQQLQKIERDSVTKADLKETTDELKKDINKIREDYTPKETHSKDFDGCQKEIKEIRQNYLTKDDLDVYKRQPGIWNPG